MLLKRPGARLHTPRVRLHSARAGLHTPMADLHKARVSLTRPRPPLARTPDAVAQAHGSAASAQGCAARTQIISECRPDRWSGVSPPINPTSGRVYTQAAPGSRLSKRIPAHLPPSYNAAAAQEGSSSRRPRAWSSSRLCSHGREQVKAVISTKRLGPSLSMR